MWCSLKFFTHTENYVITMIFLINQESTAPKVVTPVFLQLVNRWHMRAFYYLYLCEFSIEVHTNIFCNLTEGI
jgi:hypothetical protein